MNIKLIENKNLYKLFLSIVKYTPILIMVIHALASLLHYLGIQAIFLSCIGGISILFLLILYIMSYVFKFCYLYRVPLWYLTTITTLNICKSIGLLTTSLLETYQLYAIVFGFFLVIFIIYMYKNRKNPKVDPIKQLCENYVDCSC
jgi:hypothetical protein